MTNTNIPAPACAGAGSSGNPILFDIETKWDSGSRLLRNLARNVHRVFSMI